MKPKYEGLHETMRGPIKITWDKDEKMYVAYNTAKHTIDLIPSRKAGAFLRGEWRGVNW